MRKLLAVLVFISSGLNAQNQYFFPSGVTFDPAIPTPEQFLGYPVGNWHTRHDRIVEYFKELARVSPKAHFQIIGYTHEQRPQVVLTVTSPENYGRLEDIPARSAGEHIRYAGDRYPRIQRPWQRALEQRSRYAYGLLPGGLAR